MKKRLLALVLVLALLLSFAACAKTETAPAEESEASAETAESTSESGTAPVEQTAEETAEPQEKAPAAEASEETVSGALASEESNENDVGPVENQGETIQYPIGDGSQRVTMWTSMSGRLTEYISSQNDLRVLPLVLDATGATYEFVEVSESAQTEQFGLMIASGDWTDILNVMSLYTGGMAQAYEDDIIIDLTDPILENMPDYWAFVESLNTVSRETMEVDGMELGVWCIADTKFSDKGFAVRGDWLEELGLEVPTKLTDFTDSLYAIQETYAPANVLNVSSEGIVEYVQPAFNTELAGSSEGSSLYLYRDGDTICSGYTSEGFRDYLEWFHQIYADDLVDQEFYNATSADEMSLYSVVGTGDLAYFNTDAERMVMVADYADENNQGLTVQPMEPILADDAASNQWVDSVAYVENGYSITACCEDVDFTLQFLNFFFTEPGWLLSNFGEEGFSWEYDENGNARYNDQVLNNPDGIPTGACSQIYCLNIGPYYMSMRKMQVTWNEEQLAAVDVWTVSGTDEHSYPEGASLTTEESNSIVNYMNDCISYGSEAILKFMTGAEELNDASWAAYLETMDGFGLQDCLDVYQDAYNEYVAGQR